MPRGTIYVDTDHDNGVMDNPIGGAHWDSMGAMRDAMGDMEQNLQVDIEYERPHVSKRDGAEQISGGPYLVFDPPFEVKTRSGKSRPQKKSTLFTWTTKMSCPSFSIPAGPPKNGGTCAAATESVVAAEGSYRKFHEDLAERDASKGYICNSCYCGKNNYLMYVGVTANQMAHLVWARREVRKGSFASRITQAIAAMAQDEDLAELLARKLVSAKFFRIHDSGDFFSPEYYTAWIDVCYALPYVKFWCPSRQWVFPKWRALFQNHPPPKNLTLRPSALFIEARPPKIPGLDAGSMSRLGDAEKPIWNCPAYKSDEHSCASAGCRVCWVSGRTEVNYKTH